MKKITLIYLIISVIFIGCSKEDPLPESTTPVVKQPTSPIVKQLNIIDKSPSYTYPNSSTTNVYTDKFFPGYYLTLEKIGDKKYNVNPYNLLSADYRLWDPSKCYLDYNNDGRLDMFAFLTNFKDSPYASKNGKFLLVNDVLGDNPLKTYSDANVKFLPRLRTIDINKDGRMEVLFSSEEDHQLSDGSYGTPSAFQIISIDLSGNISIQKIGESVSIHGQAFGDIDSDGDIDIITWRNAYTNPTNIDLGSMPILYLNSGTGTFTQVDSFNYFKGLSQLLPVQSNGKRKNYSATAIELFDLDADGNLDLLVSLTHNQKNLPPSEYNHTSTRVYWGQGNGYFDFVNHFTDLPVDYLSNLNIDPNIYLTQLGFSFLDYDKDGDIDVITSSTPFYGGFIIQLCENKGSRKFQDVTKSKINSYHSMYPRGTQVPGTFPNFYGIRVYDKDNDGDYDLVPDHVAIWDIWSFPISQNLYWENQNGNFVLKN
jgi:hypothetical protein